MMTREEWFENAIAYFSGTMSAEEAVSFEKETAASEELSQLMQLWEITDAEAIVYEQNKEAADAFIATHQKLKPDFAGQEAIHSSIATPIANISDKKVTAWKWIAVAAAITAISIMVKMLAPGIKNQPAFVQEPANKDSSNNITHNEAANLPEEKKQEGKTENPALREGIQTAALYAQNFTTDDVPEDQNGPMANAFFYYNNRQYKEAINAIDNIAEEPATRSGNSFKQLTDFYSLYYKALSMMALSNTADAIPILQHSIQKSPAEVLTVKAQWYLSLAWLNQGKITETSNILRSIINNSSAGIYKTKARNLLSALEK